MASHFARCLRPLCLLACIATALGATVHTVLVGASGSFFDPPTVSAARNDTVTFVFSAGVHSVVQSSIDAPCSPLFGGFNSGTIVATNFSVPRSSWDLLITDDVSPIYYFCESTRPGSHCNAGMVGAINPPAIAVYNSWVSAAKLATGTPAPVFTFIASGIGAFAAGTPSITSGAPTPSLPPPPPPNTTTSSTTSSTSTSTTTSATPTPTLLPARTRVNRGAIAGGLVGGLVALFIILVLSFLLYKSKRQIQTPPPKHLLGEPSNGSTTQVPIMRSPRGGGSAGTAPSFYTPNLPEIPPHPPLVGPTSVSSSSPVSMPVRRPMPLPPILSNHNTAMRSQPDIHVSDHPYARQPAQTHGGSERSAYPAAPPMDDGDNTRVTPALVEQARNLDQMRMRMLAREVAAFMSAPGTEAVGAPLSEDRSSTYTDRDGRLDGIRKSPSPPGYHHHLSPS